MCGSANSSNTRVTSNTTTGASRRSNGAPGEEGGGAGAEDKFAASCGVNTPTYHRDRPGLSAFVLEDGAVYHTYSAYARGLDGLWGMYQWLDRAPRGRNETGLWFRRNDEYQG